MGDDIYICKPSVGRYVVCETHHDRYFKNRKRVKCSQCNKIVEVDKITVYSWFLTKDEFRKAVENRDIFALTMPVLFLCPECKTKMEGKEEWDTDTEKTNK